MRAIVAGTTAETTRIRKQDGAPLILSIDTATLGGGVCLADGDKILAAKIGDPQVSHSQSLLRDISHVLETAGVTLGSVELFAAAAGPGSFTGLRIGLASVKALATALDRPCVGISTLHAIAHSAGQSVATVAALPAGRGEVYAQLLSVSTDGVVRELDAPAPLSPMAMIDKYDGRPILKWAGPAAHLHRDLIKDRAAERGMAFSDEARGASAQPRNWVLARAGTNLCEHISALAQKRLAMGDVEAPQALQALYVRLSDAELKNLCL